MVLLLQYPLYHIAKTLHGKHPMLELVFQDVVTLHILLGTVLCWRGGWGLLKNFVLTKDWHFLVCHILGFLGLASWQVGSTIYKTGVCIDAEHGEGKEMILKLDYFLKLYTWWQEKNANQVRLTCLRVCVKLYIFLILWLVENIPRPHNIEECNITCCCMTPTSRAL